MASKRHIKEEKVEEEEENVILPKLKGKKKKKKGIKQEAIENNDESELTLKNDEEEMNENEQVELVNGSQKKSKKRKIKEEIEAENIPKSGKNKGKKKKKKLQDFDEEELPEVVYEVVKQEELMIENQEEEEDDEEEEEMEIEDDDESIMVERINGNQKGEATTPLGNNPQLWPREDLLVLFNKIEQLIPKQDKLRFKSRLDRINWNDVVFAEYSAEDCRQMWDYVQKHLRCFRELREIVQDAKDWANHPWTNYRCVKSKRHPDMPRRPLTSYMMFYMRHKNKFLNEHPSIDMPSLSKLIAEKYKTLPPTQKDKYVKLAAKEREEYLEKMKIFYQQHPELTPASKKLNEAPKKPFRLYYDSMIEASDGADKLAMLEKAKRKWKKMNDKNKLSWINKALAQTGDEVNAVEYKKKIQNLLTKEERFLKNKMAGKPEKPPVSAYRLFSKQYAAEHADTLVNLGPKERIAFIALKWKECSTDDKKKYKAELETMIKKYDDDYSQYFSSLTEDEQADEIKSQYDKKSKNKSATEAKTSSETKPKPEKNVSKKNEATTSRAEPAKVEADEEQATTSMKDNEEEPDDDYNFLKPQPQIFEGEPEPPPLHPFITFARDKCKEMNVQLNRKEAEQLWSKLTPKEKSKWDSKLKSQKAAYITLYEKFLKSLSRDDLSAYAKLKDAANKAAGKTTLLSKDISSCESDSDTGSGKTCSSSYSGSGSGSESSSESGESDKED